MWYTVEVMASENTHISGGIIQCVWFAGATIWDYDKVYNQMAEYFSNCFPIKVLASHLCCPPEGHYSSNHANHSDNFRMNTSYGRYGATYNMVVLIANFRAFE
jgi:hypothetical protein